MQEMQETPHREGDAAPPPVRWAGSGSGALDSETGVLLRAALGPLIARAHSWTELVEELARRDLALAFSGGHMLLIRSDGSTLCPLAFLGLTTAELSRRLGRPRVLAAVPEAGAGPVLP